MSTGVRCGSPSTTRKGTAVPEKLEIPGVAEYAEKLEAAKDNTRMRAHRFCGVCWPGDIPMGAKSLCGVQVLGIKASKSDCADCEREMHRHAIQHIYNGGSSRG